LVNGRTGLREICHGTTENQGKEKKKKKKKKKKEKKKKNKKKKKKKKNNEMNVNFLLTGGRKESKSGTIH